MASIKRDDVKQKWEETEFPLVCETCLGDNPYIRMTKEPHGKPCKVCETPFTVFAWQAGTRGRLKKVEICRTCARTKNVCQVCIYDLQYGLPVQLRDKVLAEEGSRGAVAAVPQSDANRAWYTAQRERAIEQGNAGAVPTSAAALRLQSMARMEPRYERNLPKLCSFYARGECNRGTKCPFRHEMPRDRNDPLSKQNTKDRFYGTNDPVAEKMMGRAKERADKRREEAKKRGEEDGEERARATCYVRFVDDRNNNNNNDDEAAALAGPKAATPPSVTSMDVRDKFYSYGEIVAVRMHADKGAFVEYTTPEATELAIRSMNRQTVNGRLVYVNWARAPKRGNEAAVAAAKAAEAAGGGAGAGAGAGNGVLRPVAPPGGFQDGTPTTAPPAGFQPVVRPPPSASAAAAAPIGPSSVGPSPVGGTSSSASGVTRQGMVVGVPRPGGGVTGVPRPGGGVIRRAGGGLTGGRGAAPQPYYPSADPGRLGSRAAPSAAQR